MNKRRWLWWSGLLLCILGVLAGLKIPYFYWHSNAQGQQLIRKAQQMVSGQQSDESQGGSVRQIPLRPILMGSTKTLSDVSSSDILGILSVPALHLTAPVLQSVTNSMLNVGTGHVPESAKPGMPGTCVIAAHNATWFRHLDALKPGDKIVLETKDGRYEYQVNTSHVISIEDGIQNTAAPTIVLEACYPLSALYLTSKRMIVTGVLTGTYTSSLTSFPHISQAPRYVAHLPSDVLKEGVTLEENQLPMGLLRFDGTPSIQFTQSDAPLSAVYTTLQLYLAYVRASEDKNIGALHQMLTSVNTDTITRTNPFFGIPNSAISYFDKFNITLDVSGNSLTGVQAMTIVQVPSGRYRVVLAAIIHGNIFELKSVTIHTLNV